MDWLKIVVGSVNAIVLLTGAAIWLAGQISKNPSRKRVGTMILGAWLIIDLISVILAFSLGWFA
ncbi:MAG: hypothetical protein ACI9OU_000916 [Candidatus Promineifilaceae bacterium]|jgi:hypothetical protein